MSNNCWDIPFSSANGQLLIGQASGLPAWATVTGGSGATITDGAGSITIDLDAATSDFELISSATASSSSEITFTGLSSTHDTFLIAMHEVKPATDSVILYMRTSTDGGSTYESGASDYAWASHGSTDGSDEATGSTGDSQISIAGDQAGEELGSGANETLAGNIWIYRPSEAAYCKIFFDCTYTDLAIDQSTITGYAARLSAADVDAVRLYMSSGNISTGNFRLYGFKA